MIRIRDKIYEEDWDQYAITAPGTSLLAFAHHLFGAIAISLIIIQSAFSLNVYIFSIWLILGIAIIMTDLFRGRNITLRSELAFGFFITFGTILSILLANVHSMFFLSNLGRLDIILFQISVGFSIALRFLITFFYVEYFTQERHFISPKTVYAKEQVLMYKENLFKTDFEHKEIHEISVFQKWWVIIKDQFWPLLIMSSFVIFAVIYSLIIYLLIPENAIAEFVIRPSLIILALLYTILLLRLNNQLPKIKDKVLEENEESEEDEISLENLV